MDLIIQKIDAFHLSRVPHQFNEETRTANYFHLSSSQVRWN